MLCTEKNVGPGSEFFFQTPSEKVKKLFYHVTGCGHFYVNPGYRISRNDYGSYLLLYIKTGSMYVWSESKMYFIKSGEAFFLNCNIPHEYFSEVDTEFVYLHFASNQVEDVYYEFLQSNDGIIANKKVSEMLATILEQFFQEFLQGIKVREQDYAIRLYECMCQMILTSTSSDGSEDYKDIVSKSQKYINSRIEDNLTLQEIAAHVNLSIYHFSRRFKDETGISPYEYILVTRINKAKQLLKTSSLSVKEIAFQTGYNSESGFSNSFKSRVGISPRKFRELPI